MNKGPKYCGTGRTNVRDVLGTVPIEKDGSNPFDFQTLVQPVFDQRCNGCHREQKAPSVNRALAMKYVPYFTSPKPFEPSRTVLGEGK